MTPVSANNNSYDDLDSNTNGNINSNINSNFNSNTNGNINSNNDEIINCNNNFHGIFDYKNNGNSNSGGASNRNINTNRRTYFGEDREDDLIDTDSSISEVGLSRDEIILSPGLAGVLDNTQGSPFCSQNLSEYSGSKSYLYAITSASMTTCKIGFVKISAGNTDTRHEGDYWKKYV